MIRNLRASAFGVALVVLVVGMCAARTAAADSDGYYCTGVDYVAYQFGGAPPMPPHRLAVIRVGTAGIGQPVALELPHFQVHGMQCGDTWIDVAAFDGYFHVTLDGARAPLDYTVASFPAGQRPERFIAGQRDNLGELGGGRAYEGAVVVRLYGGEGAEAYFLEIAATRVPPATRCGMPFVSRIVRRDRDGKELDSYTILRGTSHLECGAGD